jgi:hypothetical protein
MLTGIGYKLVAYETNGVGVLGRKSDVFARNLDTNWVLVTGPRTNAGAKSLQIGSHRNVDS